jgi:hypothetical protein
LYFSWKNDQAYLIGAFEDDELDVLRLSAEGVTNQVDVGKAATNLKKPKYDYEASSI